MGHAADRDNRDLRDDITRRYYELLFPSLVTLPKRFARREWGFFFPTGMRRHLQFTTALNLQVALRQDAPPHVYYSTAYYNHPDARNMKEKDWLGADLIFDLDCDHLEGADKMTLDGMLAHVKDHTIRLLDFCLNEFGFRQDQIEIVFSGGRGYHIHVDDDRMALLDAACRREIAIYVANRDLEVGGPSCMADVKKMGLSSGSSTSVTRIPHHMAAGWKGRYTRGILKGLEAGGSAFDLPGVGPKKRAALEAIRLNPRSLQDIREGTLARFSTPEVQAILALGQAQAMLQRADVDAPVTSDIKRLIRLPGSLHGKTGLTTTIVSLDHLEAFDPLREACHLQDLGGEFEMEGIKAGSIRLLDQTYTIEAGIPIRLPVQAAYFAVGRRLARPASVPPVDGHDQLAR